MLLQKPKNLKSVFILLKLIIKIALNFFFTFLVQKSGIFFADNDWMMCWYKKCEGILTVC